MSHLGIVVVEAECNMIGIAISPSHPTIRTTDDVAKVSFADKKHSVKLLLFSVPLCSYDFLCSSLPASNEQSHLSNPKYFIFSLPLFTSHMPETLTYTFHWGLLSWEWNFRSTFFRLCLLVIVTFWPLTDQNSIITVLQSKHLELLQLKYEPGCLFVWTGVGGLS